ncbi:MAG: sigma-70 family RNA polymerase sigma factor [Thermodesulfobacteriota bacterium]
MAGFSNTIKTARRGRMCQVNKADEKTFIGENIEHHSVKRQENFNFESPIMSYSKDGHSLNRSNLSDEELVGFFTRNGDEQAFNEIVNRYKNRIYAMARRITRDPTDAEDVMQEVYLTLIDKLDTFREESKFSSWLYRVVANASYMHLRKNKRYNNDIILDNYAPYDEDGSLRGIKDKDWSSRPDNVLFSQESLEIIEKAIDELPDSYRLVIILRDIEGFSNEEVAETLNLSLQALKSRLHRARLVLRDKISDYFFESKKATNRAGNNT